MAATPNDRYHITAPDYGLICTEKTKAEAFARARREAKSGDYISVTIWDNMATKRQRTREWTFAGEGMRPAWEAAFKR